MWINDDDDDDADSVARQCRDSEHGDDDVHVASASAGLVALLLLNKSTEDSETNLHAVKGAVHSNPIPTIDSMWF